MAFNWPLPGHWIPTMVDEQCFCCVLYNFKPQRCLDSLSTIEFSKAYRTVQYRRSCAWWRAETVLERRRLMFKYLHGFLEMLMRAGLMWIRTVKCQKGSCTLVSNDPPFNTFSRRSCNYINNGISKDYGRNYKETAVDQDAKMPTSWVSLLGSTVPKIRSQTRVCLP